MRYDKGKCYYCDEPVYVSEGQSSKVLRVVNQATGETVTRSYIHKRCRKQQKDRILHPSMLR